MLSLTSFFELETVSFLMRDVHVDLRSKSYKVKEAHFFNITISLRKSREPSYFINLYLLFNMFLFLSLWLETKIVKAKTKQNQNYFNFQP